MKDKIIRSLISFITGFAVAAIIMFKGCNTPNPQILETTVSDTIVIRDTIRPEVPAPEKEIIVRYDTIYPETPLETNYTSPLSFSIPITQKTYKTDDYKATIE